MASAGNIDGDTFDDVIIGAPDEDKVYIFLGSTISGGGTFSTVAADIIITGENAGDRFGASVSSAGEVSGDAYDDVVVGAPYNDTADGSLSNAGAAYVYYGGSPMDTMADASIYGKYENGHFGFSVADADDVNGADYDDIIIGEPGEDHAYIYYGDGSIGMGKIR